MKFIQDDVIFDYPSDFVKKQNNEFVFPIDSSVKNELDNRCKWDLRFLDSAKHISTFSKDPSTQVGCVLAKGKYELARAYNGLPAKIKDDYRIKDREWKLKVILHAEDNLLIKSRKEDINGGTVYTYPFGPCSNCAAKLIEAGISRIVFPLNKEQRWQDSINLGKELFKEAGVQVVEVEYETIL